MLDARLVPVEVADEVGGGAVDHRVGDPQLLYEHVASVFCKKEEERKLINEQVSVKILSMRPVLSLIRNATL